MTLADRILEGADDIKDLIMSTPRDIEDVEDWDDLNWLAFITRTNPDDWEWLDQNDDGIVYGFIPSADGETYRKTARVFSENNDDPVSVWHYEISESPDQEYKPIFVGSYAKLLKLYQQ